MRWKHIKVNLLGIVGRKIKLKNVLGIVGRKIKLKKFTPEAWTELACDIWRATTQASTPPSHSQKKSCLSITMLQYETNYAK